MERIRKPLAQMGAQITLTDGHAPVIVRGSALTGIDYTTPVPSAQVKTALLFAGLQAEGTTTIRESVRTRDHGELALRAFGANVERTLDSVSITGKQKLKAIEAAVPGDISSAAFFLCAAALFPEINLVLDGLGLNPDPRHAARCAHRARRNHPGSESRRKKRRADRDRAAERPAERAWAAPPSRAHWRRN